MKKGFTLQELLISMAIIGVIAAIIAPAVNNIMPDERKAKYLKAYNTLTTMTKEILNTPGIYTITYNAGVQQCSGFNCLNRPILPEYSAGNCPDCQDRFKFPAILAQNLNLIGELETLNDNMTATFITADGVIWRITTLHPFVDGVDDPVTIDVVIDTDIDNDDTANAAHLYGVGNTNPDCFRFRINNFGEIMATDSLGIAYLENQGSLNNKKADLARAEVVHRDRISNNDSSYS